MELKQLNYLTMDKKKIVLIVPSGIETVLVDLVFYWSDVLIVPSGIET